MKIITKKYHAQPWLQRLNTTVLSCQQKEEHHLVILKETIFYPTGGGQPHDLGTINDQPLLDVFEEEGIIYHVLAQPLVEEEVECVLDWERRLDHMQQHTGQHLLSAIFLSKYNYRTESFHLGADYCSIDISSANLPIKEQRWVEERVNEVIFENLQVLTYTANPEKIKNIPTRKLPDLEGPLRIVEIEGLDYSPCAGTHVISTAQIGLIKITKTEKYKGMTRVYFLCGKRGLHDYNRKLEVCADLGALLSVPENELRTRVLLEQEQKRDLERKNMDLQAQLLELKAEKVVSTAEGSPLFVNLPRGTVVEAEHLAKAILELGVFSVVVSLENRLVLAHNLPSSLDCGQLVKQVAHPLGGRGGGSDLKAQVYFAEPEKMAEFSYFLQENFR